VPAKTADAIVAENASARIDGLRSSLALLAIIALIALFATRRIPAQQPAPSPAGESSQWSSLLPAGPARVAPEQSGQPVDGRCLGRKVNPGREDRWIGVPDLCAHR
jgi:hypothetical protein